MRATGIEILRLVRRNSKVPVLFCSARAEQDAYSRGALYALLKNRLYRGEIVYRGEIYPGDHEPVIERALWEQALQPPRATRNGNTR